MAGKIYRVKLVSPLRVSVAAFSGYVSRTAEVYRKQFMLTQICQHFQRGANDSDFLIGIRSSELFPGEVDENETVFEFLPLAEKAGDPAEFWRCFRRLKRPVIQFRRREYLYQNDAEGALRFTGEVNSPPIFTFEGLGAAINDLVYGAEREGRARDAHDQQMIIEGNRALQEVITTAQVIGSRGVPEGVRRYAMEQHRYLLERQEQLNRRMDIKLKRIDRIA